ncbi:hypothetical protein QZH41_017081 [Actinostola sp. cb2023]|nr:hypothetical protein QZH41_017081 [Actinostola sp. cb2023]
MSRIIIVVVIIATVYGEKLSLAKDADLEFAKDHVPVFRFDREARALHCWPDEANDANNGTCKDFYLQAPIYYDIRDCKGKYRKYYYDIRDGKGKYRKLVWWLWYGMQKPCFGRDAHFSDWEHITINFIKDSSGSWKQDSVTWYQHDGWYTRKNTDGVPSVYIGRTAHGCYDNWCAEEICDNRERVRHHDRYSNHFPGGCGYWDDSRDDNGGRHWFPWNFAHVSVVTGKVAKRIKEEKYFLNPQLNSCFGDDSRCVLGTCGCWRNNHVFPAPFCNS